MPIVTLPTKADGSIGRAKTDAPGSAAPDLDYQVPAAEFERIKTVIIDLATEVGLTDGSTVGSLREAVGAIAAPDPALVESGVDDFVEKIPEAWSITPATGGSIYQGASAAAYGYPGAGVIALAIDATPGAMMTLRRSVTGLVFGTNPISVSARVMVGRQVSPGVIALADDACDWVVGVASDDTLGDSVGIAALGSGGARTWAIRTVVGGVVTDTAIGAMPTLAAGQMYVLRLEVDAAGARAYCAIDSGAETLVGTSVTAPAQAVYSPVLVIAIDAGAGDRSMLCDYVSWSADRYTATADAGAASGTELATVEIPAALTSSSPADVAAVAAVGTGTTAARSDHAHAHGNRAGGSLHAAAVASVSAGFMSSSDKAKLDGIAAGATVAPALASTTPEAVGTAAIGVGTTTARADHVHAHGDQIGGTLHADAGASSGFMSAAQVTKLAGIAAGATVAPALASTTPEAVGTAAVGTGTTTARADHVHALNIAGYAAGVPDLDDELIVLVDGATKRATVLALLGAAACVDGSYVVDDFCGSLAGSNFAAIVSGTGASASQGATAAPASHPGVITCSTGTTTTGRAGISETGYGWRFGDGVWRHEWLIQVPTLPTGAEEFEATFGGDNLGATTPTITVGVWFAVEQSTVSANWRCRSNRVGVEKDVDSGVAVGTGWTRLAIEVAADRSDVKYYIDGTLVATINTGTWPNNGDALSRAAGIYKIAGTTARTVVIDSAMSAKYLTTPRT